MIHGSDNILESARVLGTIRKNDPEYMERYFPAVRDFLDVMPGKFQEQVPDDESDVARHLEQRREMFQRSMMFLRLESLAEPAFEWDYARLVEADRRPRPNPRYEETGNEWDSQPRQTIFLLSS